MSEILPPTRWEIELEFVQALANLQYLNFLAQNKYLEKPEFLNYLKYLEYWREPQYARHLVYPNCLHVLTLLQNEQFREQILRQDVAGILMNDMVNRWKEPQTTFAATPINDQTKQANGEVATSNGTQTNGDETNLPDETIPTTAEPSSMVLESTA
jgi:mediator of RNA polymerase II transcription subunit 31